MQELKVFLALCGLLIVVILLSLGLYAAWPTFVQASSLIVFIFAIVVIIAIPTFLALGVWFAVTEIQTRRQRQKRFSPDPQGYYEALLVQDETGQPLFIKPADNVPLGIPSSYTYSPRLELNNTAALGLPAPGQTTAYEQPALETIIEELPVNNLAFIYGLDPQTGELAKTTLPRAVHIQLLGASGQGKSRQATSILTQLTTRNDKNHLSLALLDCEGETTAPFQHLPHVRYLADEPKEAARTLRNLVGELDRRDKTKIIYPVILIFVEEFLNLRRTMPETYRDQALEDYTTVALRGRKRGMFLFSIGQTAYVEKAIRDAQAQFLSSMAFAVKPTAARAAGFTNTELLNKLYADRRPGQFLLERPAGDSILLAPYVDTSIVSDLLAPRNTDTVQIIESEQQPANNPSRNQLDEALQAKLTQVMQLHTKGLGKGEIIQAVWGVTPGTSKAYKQAQEEYTKLMQHIMQRAEVEA